MSPDTGIFPPDWVQIGKRTTCPSCGQNAEIFRRQINRGLAESLKLMYQKAGLDYIHVPTQITPITRCREESKLTYWGLIEEDPDRREDGNRVGRWRVTRRGELYVKGLIPVTHYAIIYNDVVLRFEGGDWWISDALGYPFNFYDLMNGGWRQP